MRFRSSVAVLDQLDIHGFGNRRMLRSRRAERGRQAARGRRARGRCPRFVLEDRFRGLDARSEGPSVFGGGQRGIGCAGKRFERVRLYGACPVGSRFRRGYPGAAGRRACQTGSRRCAWPGRGGQGAGTAGRGGGRAGSRRQATGLRTRLRCPSRLVHGRASRDPGAYDGRAKPGVLKRGRLVVFRGASQGAGVLPGAFGGRAAR